ncbi:hypothetical protein BCEP4_270015 [Burkholderia cepacia]|nr:hypothetical protein BCEP4_270015 [Burkholderia cepacia]
MPAGQSPRTGFRSSRDVILRRLPLAACRLPLAACHRHRHRPQFMRINEAPTVAGYADTLRFSGTPQRGVPGQDMSLTLHSKKSRAPGRAIDSLGFSGVYAHKLSSSRPEPPHRTERTTRHDPAATRYSHRRRHTR